MTAKEARQTTDGSVRMDIVDSWIKNLHAKIKEAAEAGKDQINPHITDAPPAETSAAEWKVILNTFMGDGYTVCGNPPRIKW